MYKKAHNYTDEEGKAIMKKIGEAKKAIYKVTTEVGFGTKEYFMAREVIKLLNELDLQTYKDTAPF